MTTLQDYNTAVRAYDNFDLHNRDAHAKAARQAAEAAGQRSHEVTSDSAKRAWIYRQTYWTNRANELSK